VKIFIFLRERLELVMAMTKIGFVGAGRVGSTAAYATLHTVECDEIAIVDVIEDLAIGEAMDLETSATVLGKDVLVRGGSGYSLLKNSDVIVVSAGLARKPGMTRLNLTKANVSIIADVTKRMMQVAPKAIVIMVTNPVDITTFAAYEVSGKPRKEVLGMGSLHDTARLISEIKKMGGRNIKAMMMGEHGDSMFPLKSQAKFEGIHEVNWTRIIGNVRERGMEIIKRKGATTCTPAACAARMVKAIINDERAEMPVSAVLEGEYGLRNVALGVPAIIGREGLIRIVEYDLTDEEKTSLRTSAKIIKDMAKDAGLIRN
jgi:malate dehydrogenase